MTVVIGVFVLLVARVTFGLQAQFQTPDKPTPSLIGDSWMAIITCNIYGMAWIPADNLSDKRSVKFKEAEQAICGKMNDIFRTKPIAGNPVKQRYYTCFIDNFRQTNRHGDAPVSFTYSLVFNGSDPVPKFIIDALITASMETYHIGGKVWTLIDETWLVNRERFEFVRVNIPDYTVVKESNTQATKTDIPKTIAKTIQYRVEIANVSWTPELAVHTSPEYLHLTSGFCGVLDTLFPGHLDYKGCKVISIFENRVDGSFLLVFDLKFGQEVTASIQRMAAALILELAAREVVGGRFALSIGPALVFEESLRPLINNKLIGDQPRTPAVNVCSQKTDVVLADIHAAAGYIICNRNQAYPFSCPLSKTFDAIKQKCTNDV